MGIIHTVTEGGQIWAHRVRMLRQVTKVAVNVSLLIWIVVFAYHMSRLPTIWYQGTWYHIKANFFDSTSVNKMEIDKEIWESIAHEKLPHSYMVTTNRVFKLTEFYYKQTIDAAFSSFKKTSWITLSVFLLILSFFFIRGNLSKQQKHISGKKISSAWWIALILKVKRKASAIKIGILPLVRGTETQHILITGGTGSGKTNCFNTILPQIQKRKQKAIIIDTTGIFVERYYRAGKDIILNPCDIRSVSWHPWIECHDKFEYEAIAESLIPQSYSEHDNYWRVAARSLLSSALIKLEYAKSTSDLAKWLLFEPLSKLAEFVQGTKAAAHIDLNSEKTAGSIRSVASSFLGCLDYLQDTNDPFSIRKWVEDTETDSWLFLSCRPIQRSALSPLLACWLSVAVRSLMQLEPSLDRKLWFVIDELPSLSKLRELELLLSESRKYGGCALLALQSPSQLNAIYGPDITKTIFGNCATKIVFSEQDPEIADQISKVFGEREIKEYQEGLSYGANDVRDGVNLSLQTKNLPLVSATDIQFLEKNQAFVKLAGNVPIAKIKIKIIK